MASPIALTDPTFDPEAKVSWFTRQLSKLVRDERDVPFVKLSLMLTLIFPPAAVFLFWPGMFHWGWAGLYIAAELYFLGPFILMLHNTSHRRLYKSSLNGLNQYISWVLGPFFGETPETYFAHHMGMHHPENNMYGDLSSTLKYDRSSVIGFAHYFLVFMFGGLFQLGAYMVKNKRPKLLRRMVAGELSFYVVTAGLMWLNWEAALVVLVFPLVSTRFAMMSGNWAQHAFIDPADPENPLRNSITCINSVYNRRCFNDGYHIGHHVRANRHWTEMPEDFLKQRDAYADAGAVVFEKIDYFMIWGALMFKRFGWLAKHYVELDGQGRTQEEIANILKSKTLPITEAMVAEPQAQAAA